MGRLFFVLWVSVWMLLPAQGDAVQLLQETPAAETTEPLSPRVRAKAFSALAGLPADTESFFALADLGGMMQAAGLPSLFPGAELSAELDGFACGMSEAAAQDLKRLLPLFQVLTELQEDWPSQWGAKARPEAARAIVAQSRERQHQMGELLVQATREFHLAPIYMVLSCKPGGEQLLKQLSVLPLMLPLEADGPLVLTARGSSRGICLRGDLLDLSVLNLAPEQETELARNLQQARLYVMAEAYKNKLVLVICSHLEEVKPPRRVADSLLATDKMQVFDALIQRGALALGNSSATVVNMREEYNLSAYRNAASFICSVFGRLEGEAFVPAVEAINRLMQQIAALTPPRKVAEQFVVWREAEAIYVQMESDAGGLRFAPGSLDFSQYDQNPDTVFYAESTALHGLPVVDAAAVLRDVACIQQAYQKTLASPYAEQEEASMAGLWQVRPALEKLVQGTQKMTASLGGSTALLMQIGQVKEPLFFSARAGLADNAAWQEGERLLREGWHELEKTADAPQLTGLQVQQQEQNLLLSTGAAPGLPLVAPAGGIAVQGGAVFALHIPALLQAAGLSEKPDPELQEKLAWLSTVLERLEGAVSTRGDKLRVLLRFQLVSEQ